MNMNTQNIVVLNKGAVHTKPSDHYDNAAFDDFVAAVSAFDTTGTIFFPSDKGSVVQLQATGKIHCEEKSSIFRPTPTYSFAGMSRTMIVHSTPMVTTQDILFSDTNLTSAGERIGFRLTTDANSEFVVTCEFDDGSNDLVETLAESELPGGSSFDYSAFHEYSVYVETSPGSETDAVVTARYFIDNQLVKTIKGTGSILWNSGGLLWNQKNLTTSSTVQQAIDFISIGSDRRI